MNYTEAELRALYYYEGDIMPEDRDDPFWGDGRAYLVLNALLYGGLESERFRIAEGKTLNPAVTADPERLMRIYAGILSAARRTGAVRPAETAFRVERMRDFAVCLEQECTCAFTSTCMSRFLPQYGDKRGTVLLTYHIPAGVPRVIYRLLPRYGKAAEDELLLPPFLGCKYTARPLTPKEQALTDLDGNPPLGAYDCMLTGAVSAPPLPDAPAQLPACPEAASVFAALNAHTEPDADDTQAYLAWKKLIRASAAAML